MSKRWTDPDLVDGPEKPARPRLRTINMRPAFAGVAAPLMLGLIATSAYLNREPSPYAASEWPRTPPRVVVRPVPLPPRALAITPASPQPAQAPGIDPRFVIQASPGIDEAMIRVADSRVDERMIAPAAPVPGPALIVPYGPVPAPPAAERPASVVIPPN